MNDKQLAELEAKAESEWRKEQAEKMKQAMKAVEFVSQIKYPHAATYQLRQQRRT